MSDLLDILGTRYPIVQGPIGRLNSPKMVAAVCEAGGFGMLTLVFVGDCSRSLFSDSLLAHIAD